MPTAGRIRPGNLPAELTSFVGRGRELADVKRLLTESRLVTLTGVGGTGKTRLALRVAAQVRRAFGDGVWFVDLARLWKPAEFGPDVQDADLLADLVRAVLGVRSGGGSPRRQLTDYLAGRQVLLVLDNCEHLLPSCAVVVHSVLRACPQVRVLITSRESLAITGETLYPVPPLPTPTPGRRPDLAGLARCEAVALFVARAGVAVPGWALADGHADAVAELCRRLDGLPLAIELAATRVRILAPGQMLERLSDRFTLLSRGGRAAPARQQTLRACVEWSFELCSEPERLLWARSSVFAGGFDLEAVEGVCSGGALPRADMLAVVTGLIEKSVLVRDDVEDSRYAVSRFRMLETVREFGQERLRQAGEYELLHGRHHDWYEQLAQHAAAGWMNGQQPSWMARLTHEHPNLRAAIECGMAERGQAEAALRLAMTVPLSYWYDRGLFREARSLLDRLLTRTGRPSAARARALLFTGQVVITQGDSEAGTQLVDRGEELARQVGASVELTYAAFLRGYLLLHRGDLPAAIEAFESMGAMPTADCGLALELRLGRLVALGMATALTGDHVRADTCHEEILAITEPLGEHRHRPWALAGLALSGWQLGNADAAERWSIACLQLMRTSGSTDVYCVAQCTELLAWVAAGQQQYRRAATFLGATDALRTAAGMPLTAFGHMIAHHEKCEQQVRAGLGDEAFTTAVRRGQALSRDEAIAYALGIDRPAPTAADRPTPLTRREQQVADLIAAGMSNREIAGALVISQRTVESHVEHILAKLGVTSRTQVAAWNAGRRPGVAHP